MRGEIEYPLSPDLKSQIGSIDFANLSLLSPFLLLAPNPPHSIGNTRSYAARSVGKVRLRVINLIILHFGPSYLLISLKDINYAYTTLVDIFNATSPLNITNNIYVYMLI